MADTPHNVRQVVPFLWVRDLEVSRRFYVEGLGFTMTRRWVDDGKLRWCWLELGGASVMLQAFWTSGPDTNVPTTPTGVGVSVYFMCTDAIVLFRELKTRGVHPSTPRVGNSMWELHVTDPDGYALVFESPTDVPEETVFDESVA